ncbi:MAG: hypothetical protein JW732_07655 [Dehalococcoidia bacterium]|nr:hypothetical protein [Dehalococcoidia bacterium]
MDTSKRFGVVKKDFLSPHLFTWQGACHSNELEAFSMAKGKRDNFTLIRAGFARQFPYPFEVASAFFALQ